MTRIQNRIAAASAIVLGLTCGWPAAAQVTITEILQNPSAVSDSAGEWFELFNSGPDAVDLQGWTIRDNDTDDFVIQSGGPLVLSPGGFLVLGNNGDPATNGGVAIDFVYSGVTLANGADELVLLNSFMDEIDRVEWDGGPTFPDPNGASMSLVDPALDNNLGSSWCEAETPFGDGDRGTPGAANDCAGSPGGGPEVVVITEILQNPSAVGDGAGEWFELFNPGSEPVDLEGWTIRDDGSDAFVISTGGPLLLGPNGFLVLGNNGDPASNGGVSVDLVYSGVALANGADELVLLNATMEEIDRVGWDGGPSFPDPNGASMALIDPALDNSLGPSWCEAETPFGAGDRGTPGGPNDCPRPELVVNEIDYDQPGADSAEFVELKNVGTLGADLSQFSVQLVNGNGGAVYQEVALPPVVLEAGGYFVLCSDATTVPNCDLDVLASIQNGAPDAVALLSSGVVVDTVSYEGDTAPPFTEGSGVGLVDSGSAGEDAKGISRFPDGVDSDQNNVDLIPSCITPGAANSALSGDCTLPPPGPGLTVEIFEIQGSGLASPLLGQLVTTEDNVVTAVGADGFFIQTPPERSDLNQATSDGLFVFVGVPPAVSEGDRVTVEGRVEEFFDLTEISSGPVVTVLAGGSPLPPAVLFDAATPSPVAPQADSLERFEGMLVSFSGTATGASDRFGDVAVVARPERAFREPGIETPGLPGLPVWDGNPEVFEIDPNGLGGSEVVLFAGQSLVVEGPLTFSFGDYQVLPKSLDLGPAPVLPRGVREALPGELTVATQNLLRLFDTVDDPGVDDPVTPPEELEVRLAKLSRHIRETLSAPDVLAVQEVENLGVLEQLAARIAADDASVDYRAHLIEGNDVGGIDVGYLTREDSIVVTSVEAFGTDLQLSVDGSLLFDRPPLVLEAQFVGAVAPFPLTVINLHQRSLSGIDGSEALRVKIKRLEQAEQTATLVQSLQTADPARHLLVTGDFNGFEFTDGFVDVVGVVSGNLDPRGAELPGADLVEPDLTNEVLRLAEGERYSFVRQGSAQVLDHVLTSSALGPLVSGVAFARGNADVPAELLLTASTPLRTSDHDGLVLFVDTGQADADLDGVANAADRCPGTEIPESIPSLFLGFFRFALVDADTTFDTRRPGQGRRVPRTVTTGDTAGCSCEQILEELGVRGRSQRLFGCHALTMARWIRRVRD